MWYSLMQDSRFVIILLEVVCCAYSLVLGYLSEKLLGKVLNIVLAIIWVIAIVLNILFI